MIRERMCEYLNGKGVRAVTAWGGGKRSWSGGPVAAVSLRGCAGGPAGFQDYLGERYNEDSGRWEELYGRKVRLIFGVDLYGTGGEEELCAAFDAVAAALHAGGPEGLRVAELSAGETGYEQETGLFKCPAEAVCEAYLYAVADEGGAFMDFEVRGETL